jgi:hypothetical protein
MTTDESMSQDYSVAGDGREGGTRMYGAIVLAKLMS